MTAICHQWLIINFPPTAISGNLWEYLLRQLCSYICTNWSRERSRHQPTKSSLDTFCKTCTTSSRRPPSNKKTFCCINKKDNSSFSKTSCHKTNLYLRFCLNYSLMLKFNHWNMRVLILKFITFCWKFLEERDCTNALKVADYVFGIDNQLDILRIIKYFAKEYQINI